MIAIDTLERMRVAAAVNCFGIGAATAITTMLNSGDGERRKLAVAILNERVLPIAAYLLKSPDCDDRKLGASILYDMWPVVAKDHLLASRSMATCEANVPRKGTQYQELFRFPAWR
jgi:hypothetical protein